MKQSLDLSAYSATTPEAAVFRFLEGWKNYKLANSLECCQKSWVIGLDDPLESLKAILSVNLKAYKVTSSVILNSVVQAVTAVLTISRARGVSQNINVVIRVIKEIQPLLPSPDGDWGVNPITATMEVSDAADN